MTSLRRHLTHFMSVQRYHFFAVSVSLVSSFSGFLVNRSPFGFGDFGSVSGVPVRFAAFLSDSPFQFLVWFYAFYRK